MLAGEQVEVRRPVKYPPECILPVEWYHPTIVRQDGEEDAGPLAYGMADEDRGWPSPWAPGAVLWVREACRAEELADRVAIMVKGSLQFLGTVGELRQQLSV
jgi:hypothetical protein